jgi:hypothetical protein
MSCFRVHLLKLNFKQTLSRAIKITLIATLPTFLLTTFPTTFPITNVIAIPTLHTSHTLHTTLHIMHKTLHSLLITFSIFF